MRLWTKFSLVFLVMAMLPVMVVGIGVMRLLESDIKTQVTALQSEQVRLLGLQTDRALQDASDWLRDGLESFDLQLMDNANREGALRLLYRQRDYVNALAILDSTGELASPMVYLSSEAAVRQLPGEHTAVSPEHLAAVPMAALVRDAQPPATDPVWGEPIVVDGKTLPLVPLVVPLNRGRFILFALVDLTVVTRLESSLTHLLAYHDEGGGEPGLVAIFNRSATPLFQFTSGTSDQRMAQMPEAILRSLGSGKSQRVEIATEHFAYYVYALTTADLLLVLGQPRNRVLEALAPLQEQTWFLILSSIAGALLVSTYLSNQLARPAQELARSALAIARGNYDTHVNVYTHDEIGELADTFNYMAHELKGQKVEIDRQSEEIREWNRKLQARVEERTKALREAQGYLVQTQKLAAVAELASGVAHELNNPLAAVLGFVQLLAMRKKSEGDAGEADLKVLNLIEVQAQRCRETVGHMLRFSQEQVDRGAFDVVDLAEVVGSVLKVMEGRFAVRSIQLDLHLEPGRALTYANRAQLLQAFVQLLTAIRPRMSSGSRLEISAQVGEREHRVTFAGPIVELHQAGAPSGSAVVAADDADRVSADQAMAQGLELWLAGRIFQEHDGLLEFSVPEGENDPAGARLIVHLPAYLGAPPRSLPPGATDLGVREGTT